jgi:hypothetical protein
MHRLARCFLRAAVHSGKSALLYKLVCRQMVALVKAQRVYMQLSQRSTTGSRATTSHSAPYSYSQQTR